MIIDSIENFKKYIALHPGFAAVAENISKYLDPSLETGKYPIDGDNVYAVVNHYQTTPAAEDKFENHRRYIDIQCITEGTEEIHSKDAKGLLIAQSFDDANDYEMYKTPESYMTAELNAGEFAVYFPGEAHRPGCMTKAGAAPISKVIFKVKL